MHPEDSTSAREALGPAPNPDRIGQPWPAPLRLARLLGIHPPGHWAELTTGGPLQITPTGTTLYLRDAEAAVQVPVPRGVLDAWAGYAFDVFGRLLPPEIPAGDWPIWSCELKDGKQVVLQGWRWRAARAGALFYAQLLWTPTIGIVKSIQVAADPPRWGDNHFADAGAVMRLLHQIPVAHGGRPRTAQEEARDTLLDAARRAVVAGCPLGKLRRADLGAQLGISERQVGNLLDRADWHMAHLKRECARQFSTEGS
jgi:hypothetical protein